MGHVKARGSGAPLLLLWLALAIAPVHAQARRPAAADDELFRTIASLDRAVFDAVNRCELEKLGGFFVEDLEFYHDNGGLIHRSRQSFVDSVKANLCGKVRRELVDGTLEVYPMHGFGAVQMGVHRFLHPGRKEPAGEAKFMHLWQNKDGAWKITRIISYDHHERAAATAKTPPADVGPGRITWFDITTTSLARAKDFYGKLFDWQFAPVQGTDQAAEIVAGGTPIGTLRVAEGKISGFNGVVYVQVTDLPASCKKAKDLGGTVEAGFPFNLPDGIGAIAVVLDPSGHPVGLYSRTPLPAPRSPSR